MKTESMHVGMRVRHPQYGEGTVKSVSEMTSEIRFNDGIKTVAPEHSEMEPAEPQIALTGMTVPLATVIAETVHRLARELKLERTEEVAIVQELGLRWRNGTLTLHPADPTLQTKEVPLEAFFHKIVMMRNNLRTLEQKVNAHTQLSDAEKFDMQQYITRCYGSMTTFNVLFKDEEGQFRSK